jgi:hypothetical protein
MAQNLFEAHEAKAEQQRLKIEDPLFKTKIAIAVNRAASES